MRCATDERYCESFRDQNRPNVFAIRSKHSAISFPVIGRCPLRALRVGTADVLEVEPTCSDELAETPGCSSSELCLGGAAGVASFGRVEADQSNRLIVNTDAVPVFVVIFVESSVGVFAQNLFAF